MVGVCQSKYTVRLIGAPPVELYTAIDAIPPEQLPTTSPCDFHPTACIFEYRVAVCDELAV